MFIWIGGAGSFDNIELAMLEKVKVEREEVKKREKEMERLRRVVDESGWVGVKG